jgi:hypothetical protein
MQKVVNPIGEVVGEEATQASWRIDVTGKTIGFLSNGKANSAELLQVIEKRMRAKYDLAGVVWANKSIEAQGPGRPATTEIIDRLSSGAVAVLAASGD